MHIVIVLAKNCCVARSQNDDNVHLLVGLDGRKMSKSYGNTIPLFQTPKQRQKAVNKIVTNLKEPGEPKQKDESPLFEIYQAFATPSETAAFEQAFERWLGLGRSEENLVGKNRRRIGQQNRCVQRF